jgi:hypothetical protein
MEDEQNVLEHAKYLKGRGRLDEAIHYLKTSIKSLAKAQKESVNIVKFLISLAMGQSELMAKTGIKDRELDYLKIARDASVPKDKTKALHGIEWKVVRLQVCRKLVDYYNK